MKDIESAVEGILFAAGEPGRRKAAVRRAGADRETLDAVVRKLADDYAYERRGIRIVTLEDSYQMCSRAGARG